MIVLILWKEIFAKGEIKMVAFTMLAVIIMILIVIIFVLLDRIDEINTKNDIFYAQLRREFDIRIEELQESARIQGEIIDGMRALRREQKHGK